jgi:phage repressor protein C with HTH and peptisase S24 domain
MLHLRQNLRLIRLLSGKTQTEFGSPFNATKAMVVSYEKGKANPDNLFISRVSKYAGVTIDDLMNKQLSEEDIHIKEEKEEKEDDFLTKRRKLKNKVEPFLVPLVPVKAQAGYVKAFDQQVFMDTLEKFALPPGVNPLGAIWKYWEVEGESMEPVFHSGDVILTSLVPPEDWGNLRNFYLYVIVTKDRVLFKRLFCKNPLEWVLISENEEHSPQQLLRAEDVKEVWVFRRHIVNKAPPTKVFDIKV